MTRRHLINAPVGVIPETLNGLARTYPHLIAHRREGAQIVCKQLTLSKVDLASGGSSGQEPRHAGFVSTGPASQPQPPFSARRR